MQSRLLSSRVPIPKGDRPLYMAKEVNRTVTGTLRRLLNQPCEPGLEPTCPDGGRRTCRAILRIMRSGVPINRNGTSRDEVVRFFPSAGSECDPVDSFQFNGDRHVVFVHLRIGFIEHAIVDQPLSPAFDTLVISCLQ